MLQGSLCTHSLSLSLSDLSLVCEVLLTPGPHSLWPGSRHRGMSRPRPGLAPAARPGKLLWAESRWWTQWTQWTQWSRAAAAGVSPDPADAAGSHRRGDGALSGDRDIEHPSLEETAATAG